MTADPRIRHALDIAASGDRPAVPPASDLARARSAARARSRRRLRWGLALVAVGAIGLGRLDLDARPAEDVTTAPGTAAPPDLATRSIALLSTPLDAGPFTFGLTPEGWSAQPARPSSVTIAPDDGSTSPHPDDFRGKLVITFDRNAVDGEQVVHDGRAIWITGDSGTTTMSTLTLPGEPPGVVRIQYPDDTGWTDDAMVRFLASVHVGPDARPGLG